MKFYTSDSNGLILRRILFLRYGTDDVAPQKPPPHLLSWRQVSQLLKVPYHRVLVIQRQYFETDAKCDDYYSYLFSSESNSD